MTLFRRADKYGLLIWSVTASILFVVSFWLIEVLLPLRLYAAVNFSTFLVMFYDKIQAGQRDIRISERSLFIMTFLGGSLGVIIAMYTIRHKSRKRSFQIVVWFLLLLQVLALSFLLRPQMFGQEIIPIDLKLLQS